MEGLSRTAIREYQMQHLKDVLGDSFNVQDISRDYIWEMLQSHDVDKLISKLQQQVSDKVAYIKEKKGSQVSFYIECGSIKERDEILSNKKFDELLSYFNYYVSLCSKFNPIIYIEPVYTDDATEAVMKNNHGVCYHITHKSNLNNIMKKGLRCRVAAYRIYPEKVFLYSVPEFYGIDRNLRNVAEELNRYGDNWIVLKINLNHHHAKGVRLFHDTTMHDDNCYFAYETIPPECITFYKNTTDLSK